ncbi:MAG: hypothetical protein WDN48_11640 [Pseudolabrys sp.]
MMTKTIRAGFAATALLLTPIVAQAADLPRQSYKAPAYSAPSYANWNGFYVGINGGYGFGKSNWDVPAVSPSPKGALVGGTLGYNFQTGTWGGLGHRRRHRFLDHQGQRDRRRQRPRNQELLARHRARASRLCRLQQLAALHHRRRRRRRYQGDQLDDRFGHQDQDRLDRRRRRRIRAVEQLVGQGRYLYVDLGKFDCGISCGAATDNVSFKSNVVRAGIN